MSYLDTDQIGSDDNWRRILKKHLDYHVEEVRRKSQNIASFSKANHIFYKRFKHAGMPIFSNLSPKASTSPPLNIFESFSVVAEGPNPFKDSIVIPYSKSILKRYETLISDLQTILLEMTKNRIECLKRSVTGIIPVSGQAGLFSSQETELMLKKIDEYYNIHPVGDIPTNLAYNINVRFEKIQWYLKEEDSMGIDESR